MANTGGIIGTAVGVGMAIVTLDAVGHMMGHGGMSKPKRRSAHHNYTKRGMFYL